MRDDYLDTIEYMHIREKLPNDEIWSEEPKKNSKHKSKKLTGKAKPEQERKQFRIQEGCEDNVPLAQERNLRDENLLLSLTFLLIMRVTQTTVRGHFNSRTKIKKCPQNGLSNRRTNVNWTFSQ